MSLVRMSTRYELVKYCFKQRSKYPISELEVNLDNPSDEWQRPDTLRATGRISLNRQNEQKHRQLAP